MKTTCFLKTAQEPFSKKNNVKKDLATGMKMAQKPAL